MGAMAAVLEKYYQKILLSQRFSPVAMKNTLEPFWQENGYRQKRGTVKEILVISLNAIGDSVLYSAFLRELRRNNPDSRITLFVTPLVYNLMELCPYVNTIHSLPYHWEEGFDSYFPRFIRFVQEKMLAHRFDISVCVQWSDDKRPMNLLAYLSGAAQRYGISDKSILAIQGDFSLIDQWEFLLTHPLITPPEITHEAERALYVVKAMGGNVEQKEAEIWLNSTDVESSRKLLDATGWREFAVLGLGAGHTNRKYPLDKWIVALQQIWDAYGTPFVLLGGKNERDDGVYIERGMPDGSVLSLSGRTTLRETAAIIKNADCYLGNVTGMMHMAAALQTPLITIFREAKIRAAAPPGIFSESTRFAPWQAKAVVLQPERAAGECMHTVVYGGCKENAAHCIAQVTPAEIVAAYERLRGRL